MFCLTEWSLIRFIGRKPNKIYDLEGETKHFQGGGQNCWESGSRTGPPKLKNQQYMDFRTAGCQWWFCASCSPILWMNMLNALISPLCYQYLLGVCVCVCVCVWWGYDIHFISVHKSLYWEKLSENYIKGALSALVPYLFYYFLKTNICIYLLATPQGMWDVSSMTRDWTQDSCIESCCCCC